MTLSATKMCLSLTIRYSQQRLAIGASGESDTPIMSYQLQQNAVLPLLARVIVLNIGYNKAKDLFENPTGQEHTQIRVFCACKCLISWNMETTARICRERCGGGSYLASAGIPSVVEGAHSGMTAEGDNRVLMQKVVKDILADFQKKRHPMPSMTMCPKREIPNKKRVSDLETLTNLIYYKEVAEIKNISGRMQKMVMEDGKPFFDAWMYELSDEQQALATAFGDRYMLEAALEKYNQCTHTGI